MKIITTSQFAKDFKHLSKKYPSLANDLRQLQASLLENPDSFSHFIRQIGHSKRQ